MEIPAELFIKKFFFGWSTRFSVFEPPHKNHPNKYMSFQPAHHPPPYLRKNSKKHLNAIINN